MQASTGSSKYKSGKIIAILVFLGFAWVYTVSWSGIRETRAIAGPSVMTTTTKVGEAEEERVKTAAIKALAQRLGTRADEIQIESLAAHTWPDPSLGCGEGENMNIQVMTPGYVIRLSVAGRIHEYHTDQSATIVKYCPRPREP